VNLDQEIDVFVAQLAADNGGKGPPKATVDAFRILCHRTGLSPVGRQIYLINRGGKWQPQTSIDGLRSVAARQPAYKGQAGPFWTTEAKGEWTDVPPDESPYAARVGVFVEGAPQATFAAAKFQDYAAGPMWKKFPSTMIAKCAEALALRKAFPVAMAGLYTAEEMEQTDKPARGKAKAAEPAPVNIEALAAKIRAVTSIEVLEGPVRASLAKLPPEIQVALTPVYEARREELS
jgi:phage recombination protein Bet